MKKVDISEIYKNPNQFLNTELNLGGWVKTVRDLKNFGFIELTDGTCFKGIQIVFNSDLSNYDKVSKVDTGSSLFIVGELVLTPENKQPFEVHAKSIEILNETNEEYPLQKKRHSVEFLREIAYLRPRTNLFNAVFRVRSESAFAIHKFFNERGFVYTHTPIITGFDCEGGSDVFRVTTHNLYDENPKEKFTPESDFFGKKVFLSPTGQLEGEALALAFGKIYTFGPTFRSENSNTTRHASEFWMIEPEVAFNELEENMDLIEGMVKYLINYLLEHCKTELEFFNNFVDKNLLERLHNVVNNQFARITYTEAVKLLEKNNDKFEFKAYWGCDMQSEHEKYLSEVVFKKPVFVTDYPKEIKAFYMRLNDDNKTVRACDLLVPGIGEMVGGSEREERYDVLKQRIKECGLKEEDYWWYLNLRKFGSVKHSGFGLGFERFIMYVTGVANIRDVQLFPRTPKNCEF